MEVDYCLLPRCVAICWEMLARAYSGLCKSTRAKEPVPILQEAGGPQGRSRQVQEVSHLQGFEPLTVQPVVSRYTDHAIPAHTHTHTQNGFLLNC
jgi:hypothetical protein